MNKGDENNVNRFFDLIDQAVDGLTVQERKSALVQLEEIARSVRISSQVH